MLSDGLIFRPAGKIVRAANKGQLQIDDLRVLLDAEEAGKQYEHLAETWAAEMERAKRAKEAFDAAEKAKPPPPADGKGEKRKPKAPPEADVGRALWPLVKCHWMVAMCLMTVQVALQFGGPFMLSEVIQILVDTRMCAVRTGSLAAGGALPPECFEVLWPGYAWAGGMLLLKGVETLVTSHQQLIMTKLALRVRSAMVCAIYRKCLHLAGMGDSSTGQIQNLMAVDAQMLLQLAPMFNMLFFAPVQIVVVLIWLGTLIGPSCLAGETAPAPHPGRPPAPAAPSRPPEHPARPNTRL